MATRQIATLVCAALLAVPAYAQDVAALYRPTTIFQMDTGYNYPGQLNNRGDFTLGFKSDSPYPGRQSLYLAAGGGVSMSTFIALNDRAQAIGYDFVEVPISHPDDDRYRFFPAYYDGATVKEFVPGYAPTALNNGGTIVARTAQGSTAQGSIIFDIATGGSSALPTLNGSAPLASDINESGQVVGTAVGEDGSRQAFIFENGDITALPFGGSSSEALQINAAGQILGSYVDEAGASRAILYSNGAIIDLTATVGLTLPNSGAVLNDLGQILFYRGSETLIYIDGVAYPIKMVDNDPAMPEFFMISSLNDEGQLLAATCPNSWGGYPCALVTLDFVTTIPEPPVWAMLAVGVLLTARPWRRVRGAERQWAGDRNGL